MMPSVESRAVAGSVLVLTRPGVAAPQSIDATAQLEDVGLGVSLRVRVDPGGTARVVRLAVTPLGATVRDVERTDDGVLLPPAGITSRALRVLRVDALAREAVRQQERPVAAPDAGWNAGTRQRAAGDRAAVAAQVYLAAVKAGSRAPTLAVAAEFGYSRTHASRLIRQARDTGMLPRA
jgi:hypothetical protein